MYTTHIKVGRWLTLLGYFSLMIGLYCWHLVINDTAKHLISVLLIFQIGPLLFPLRGLLSGNLYTHSWSMYMAIYYFIVGVWYGADNTSLWFGIFVVLTSLTFFAGTAIFTRYTGKSMNQTSQDAS